MTERKKREPPLHLPMNFGEALKRFSRVTPKDLETGLVGEVLQKKKDAEKKIDAIRKEIDDGARPRKGRFRL